MCHQTPLLLWQKRIFRVDMIFFVNLHLKISNKNDNGRIKNNYQ